MKNCAIESDANGADAVKLELVTSKTGEARVEKPVAQRGDSLSPTPGKRANESGGSSVVDVFKPMTYGGNFGIKLMSGEKPVSLFPTCTKITGYFPGYVPPKTRELSENSSESESEELDISHIMLVKRAKLLSRDPDGDKAKRVTFFN